MKSEKRAHVLRGKINKIIEDKSVVVVDYNTYDNSVGRVAPASRLANPGACGRDQLSPGSQSGSPQRGVVEPDVGPGFGDQKNLNVDW